MGRPVGRPHAPQPRLVAHLGRLLATARGWSSQETGRPQVPRSLGLQAVRFDRWGSIEEGAPLDRGAPGINARFATSRLDRAWYDVRQRFKKLWLLQGNASMTTPTTFIWTFPLCDLQGYVDLISLAHCFASRRSDLGLFLFIFVGNFLFSMMQNPSVVLEWDLCVDVLHE
jgi:hypothetical protein